MNRVRRAVGCIDGGAIRKRFLGQGVGIALLDTGIVPHPDFGNRIQAFVDFVGKGMSPYDDSGHGTHVAGILAGSGQLSRGLYEGMAPKAHLFVGKVLDRGGDGTVEYVLKAIEWILWESRLGKIQVVNISVGARPDLAGQEEERLLAGVERLWDAGLLVVASAGNYGPASGSVAVPGSHRKVITVGAVDCSSGKEGGRPWPYSGRGPTKTCVVKPDLVAPGMHIMSCHAGYAQPGKSPYIVKSGTSMATPVVAGATACLLSKYPNMTNGEVKLRLRKTTSPQKEPAMGWGLLNVAKLLEG